MQQATRSMGGLFRYQDRAARGPEPITRRGGASRRTTSPRPPRASSCASNCAPSARKNRILRYPQAPHAFPENLEWSNLRGGIRWQLAHADF
jgi:hypothetical protein